MVIPFVERVSRRLRARCGRPWSDDGRGCDHQSLRIENYAYRDPPGRETVTWLRTFRTRRRRRFDAYMIYSARRGRVVDYLGTHQHLAVDGAPRETRRRRAGPPRTSGKATPAPGAGPTTRSEEQTDAVAATAHHRPCGAAGGGGRYPFGFQDFSGTW